MFDRFLQIQLNYGILTERIYMSKTGQWVHKMCEDAELMTKGEFICEHGEQHLEYYEQVQANNPTWEEDE